MTKDELTKQFFQQFAPGTGIDYQKAAEMLEFVLEKLKAEKLEEQSS